MKKSAIFAVAALLFLSATAIIVISKGGRKAVTAYACAEAGAPQLVIDAGHGGLDGGACAADGTPESVLNLSIALKMRDISRLFGVCPVMTRESEDLDYPADSGGIRAKKVWDQKTRVALINATENAVLISVHQNTFPDARASGTEVLYSKAEGSEALAQIAHANLTAQLCPDNRRVAAPISEKIYLMKNIRCPAILAECGFLSNPGEAEKLKCDEYRTELAIILIASYFQYVG